MIAQTIIAKPLQNYSHFLHFIPDPIHLPTHFYFFVYIKTFSLQHMINSYFVFWMEISPLFCVVLLKLTNDKIPGKAYKWADFQEDHKQPMFRNFLSSRRCLT